MKTLVVTVSLALAGVSSAQAQMFRPSVGTGAVVGAVAGGLIGGHNGDRWAQGAIIGGVAGALIGAALTPQEYAYPSPPPVYQPPVYGQQVYGQQVYSQPQVIQTAPTVPNAQVVPAAPVYVEQAPPQVVYVESAPRVVYVPAPPPRVVYVAPRPVIGFGFSHFSGPRYYAGHHDRYSRGYGHGRGRGHR
jgi:hypothetical protein